ncbi:hypothetical protein IW262DRAFT_1459429 [Armillaria fumosa]|nr:hypothetical protein IW262DRAFT_1459429 [Armillaria fumosa]
MSFVKSSTASIRFSSPAAADMLSAAGSTSASPLAADSASVARCVALQDARSVDQLIDMVPGDYVDCLREPLRGIAATATKLLSARATLVKWRGHAAAGTMPSHLFRQAPEIQLTADFGSSEGAAEHRQGLVTAHKAYLDQLLQNAINAKSDDCTFLEEALEPAALFNRLHPIVSAQAAHLLAHRKVPVIKYDAMGEFDSVTFEEDAVVKTQGKNVQADALAYAFRVISIVEATQRNASAKQDRKKALKQAADVEMADATRPGPSTQSMIDRAVAAALKNADKKGKGKNKDGKKKASSTSKAARYASELPPPPVYLPRAGRKPPNALKGAEKKKKPAGKTKPAKKDKGKGKEKAK